VKKQLSKSFTKADFTALITAAKKPGSGTLGAGVDEAGLEPDGTTRLSVKLASEGRGMLIAEHRSKGSLIFSTEVDEDSAKRFADKLLFV